MTDLKLWKFTAVTVDGKSNSQPEKVYEYAKNNYQHIYNDKTRQVYCLIDCDDHKSFKDTLQKDNNIPNLIILESIPCFELWILLHFQKDFANNDRHELYKALKKYGVSKDDDNYGTVYTKKLKDKTETAIKNSEHLYNQDRDTNLAYTKIHILMNQLKEVFNIVSL